MIEKLTTILFFDLNKAITSLFWKIFEKLALGTTKHKMNRVLLYAKKICIFAHIDMQKYIFADHLRKAPRIKLWNVFYECLNIILKCGCG